MDERNALAWLGRKIGWGLTPGQLDAWSELGVATVIDHLVDPDEHGVNKRIDRFKGIDKQDQRSQRMARLANDSWTENAVTSPRPLETFMEFFWSGYFAVSFRVVRPRRLMLPHMNKLAQHSLGNFATLLRAVSRDPAMLDFLDGGRNTKGSPNENYARELLELYSVGVGNFTEDDVYAASRALTGWNVNRRSGKAEFRAADHDNTPQELLGVEGVRNIASAVEAAVLHPATAVRVVDKLAIAILGQGYNVELTAPLVDEFAATMEIKPVVRGLLELGVEGQAQPSILEPLAWYVMARRVPTSNPQPRLLREYFELSGQRPLFPPNVGGFPGPDAYLSTSATLARFNMATHLVEQTYRPITGVDFIELTDDLDALAVQLGLVDGFAPASEAALVGLPPGTERMAAILASPDMLVV